MDPRSLQMAGIFGQQPGMMPMARQPGSLRRMGPSPMAMNPRVQAPGSAGLFDQYMQGGMMPRYQPPDIAGIFGDTGRGYRGFLGPQMPKLTLPQAQVPPWIAGLLGGGQENSPTGVAGPSSGIGGDTPGGFVGMEGVTAAPSSGDDGSGSSGVGGSGVGAAGGTGTGSAGVGPGWARGGLVTQDRLIGPNPPGPDDGYGALDAGEVVIPKNMVSLLAQYSEAEEARKNGLPMPTVKAMQQLDAMDKPSGLLPTPTTDQSQFTVGGSRPPLSAAAKAREKALRDKLKRGG